jgi:acyl-CoA thioester hydrolase
MEVSVSLYEQACCQTNPWLWEHGGVARHIFECPMRWSDMDALRHINNVNLVRYLEEARVDWLFRRGAFERTHDEGLLVVRNEIDYRRQLHYRHEPVPIELWVSRLAHASFEVSYEVVDTDEDGTRTLYARAKTVLAVLDMVAGHPKRVSPEARVFLERYAE